MILTTDLCSINKSFNFFAVNIFTINLRFIAKSNNKEIQTATEELNNLLLN